MEELKPRQFDPDRIDPDPDAEPISGLTFLLELPHYDWIAIVGRRDEREMFATTYAAICRWKYGRRDEAAHDWAAALAQYGPLVLLARANLVWFFERWGVDATVPGDEPTRQEEVTALVSEMLDEGAGSEDQST
jgi:hypothetical protein